MELLYIWIKQNENKYIENLDVNFTSNYTFSYRDNIISLTENETQLPYNFWGENIINVTAIVGENGIGKTTLLKHIFNTNISSKIEKYPEFDTIQIFLENNEIYICTNINPILDDKLERSPNIHFHLLKVEQATHFLMDKITKIFLSNSYFDDNHPKMYSHGSMINLPLTLNGIEYIKNKFYEKQTLSRKTLYDDNFYNYNKSIQKAKTKQNYQQFLDIAFMQYLVDNNMIEFDYLNKITIDVQLFTEMIDLRLLNSSFEEFEGYLVFDFLLTKKSEIIEYGVKKIINICKGKFPIDALTAEKLYYSIIEHEVSRNENNNTYKSIYEKLKIIFKTELAVSVASLLPKSFFKFIDKIYEKSLVETLNIYEKIIFQEKKEKNYAYSDTLKFELEYFNNALKEIDKFKEFNVNNEKIQFSRKGGVDFLKFFWQLIENKEYSFLLKYLCFTDLTFSSGERAYLNFMSWINAAGNKNLLGISVDSCFDNVLILIDEIDLYCHPEWQRKILNEFLKHIGKVLPNKKIQVIFSTHSPIPLSDIPKSNTLLMCKNKNKVTFANRDTQKETFGANIYDLFNDCFFLKNNEDNFALGLTGSFANDKIISCIEILSTAFEEKLHDKLSTYKINDFQFAKKIAYLIGEPVIKNKLIEMINRIEKND